MMAPRSSQVLVNVWTFRGNTYPATWCSLLDRAGATVTPLSRKNLLASPTGVETLVHLQWPEVTISAPRLVPHLRKTVSLARLVVRARLRGNRVMATMHNVDPHDSDRLGAAFWRFLSWAVTDVHLLDGAGWPEIERRFPALGRVRRHEIPHMNYVEELLEPPRPTAGPTAVRGAALLYFGAIRAYKGIESLVEVVARSHESLQWQLVLRGRPQDPVVVGRIEAAARGHERIDAELVEVDAADLEAAIRDSDLVVLPFRNVLNSGSVIMSLSVGRPVLVPDTPTFRSIAGRAGTGWVTTFNGTLRTEDIERALSANRSTLDLSWCDRVRIVPMIENLLGAPA